MNIDTSLYGNAIGHGAKNRGSVQAPQILRRLCEN